MGILDQLMAAGGGDTGAAVAPVDVPPASIPDPEPHLAPADEEAAEPQNEVGILKQLISLGRQYTDMQSVEESERLEMEKATTIFQKLLAQNEKMSDQLTGADPATRKALGGQ